MSVDLVDSISVFFSFYFTFLMPFFVFKRGIQVFNFKIDIVCVRTFYFREYPD